MGLFGKKKEGIEETSPFEKSDEILLKEELETEVEKLQKEFRTKQYETRENEQKLQFVKDEYNSVVASLMEIKKETNQKKMELDVVKREYRDIKIKIENTDERYQKSKNLINELEETEADLKFKKEELKGLIKKDTEIKEKISEGQSILHGIKSQEIQKQKELEGIASSLHNAKQGIRSSDNTDIFTSKEKEFIKGQIGEKQVTKGVIEAASVVAASLKSKLNMAQKELETVQQLLEKEREEHSLTKEKLKRLQGKGSKNKS